MYPIDNPSIIILFTFFSKAFLWQLIGIHNIYSVFLNHNVRQRVEIVIFLENVSGELTRRQCSVRLTFLVF